MSQRAEMWRTLRRLVRAGDKDGARKLAKRLGYKDAAMVTRLIETVWKSVHREPTP